MTWYTIAPALIPEFSRVTEIGFPGAVLGTVAESPDPYSQDTSRAKK
jgi:hypothetical protein